MKKLFALIALAALGTSAFAAGKVVITGNSKSESAKPAVTKAVFDAQNPNASKNAFGQDRAATYGAGGNRNNVSKS